MCGERQPIYMKSNKKTVYRSKIDWWVWCVVAFTAVEIWAVSIGTNWWIAAINGGALALMMVAGLFGCWYEVEDDQLTVYQFFRPNRFPISKIREVKKTVGYLATAGMSKDRVSIKFVDRSVMKSFMPLEISPAARDKFMAQLKSINPEITVN